MMEEEIVGFRFYPTPGELVNHYLRRKLQKIDHGELCVIPELNIYDYDPRDLLAIYNEKSCIRSDNSGGCFFLCPRGTNSSTSKKNCNKRRAGNGYWKETSKKQDVEDEETGRVIGTKRIFAYYEGNQKNGSKTDLASHEYHLTEAIPDGSIADPAEYSLCHVKKKKNQRKKDVSKKQQISRLSESPSCGAPYLIGTVKTPGPNLEVSSLGVEGLKTMIQSDYLPECSKYYLNNEQDDTQRAGLDLVQSCLQDGAEAEEARETTMNLQPLATMSMFNWEDSMTMEAVGEVGNLSMNCNYDDGFFIEDLWVKDSPGSTSDCPVLAKACP